MSQTAPRGALAAAAAFFIWGLFPLYWKQLGSVPPLQVLAHRGLWCALGVWAVLSWRGDLSWIRQVTARQWRVLATGGVLITCNWGVYVWAVVNNHVLDTSLGYFMSPLVNVLLAVVVLHERLTNMQRAAVAIAACGVVLLAWQVGHPPWVALGLALSFGLYGLVRKLVVFDPLQGLAIESGLMAVPALAYLLWCAAVGQGQFLAGNLHIDALLVIGGPVTAIPLALFAVGAQRVSMLTLGLMQYIVPTMVLLLGVWVYHEPFGGLRALAFGCIWVALALFSGEALWRRQAPAVP